jgi:ribosomal protein S27AE
LQKGGNVEIGIGIFYKDGSRDWFDPVDEDVFDAAETEDKYIIDNGHYVYEVEKSKVLEMRKYDLCPECGHEINTTHGSGCSLSEQPNEQKGS